MLQLPQTTVTHFLQEKTGHLVRIKPKSLRSNPPRTLLLLVLTSLRIDTSLLEMLSRVRQTIHCLEAKKIPPEHDRDSKNGPKRQTNNLKRRPNNKILARVLEARAWKSPSPISSTRQTKRRMRLHTKKPSASQSDESLRKWRITSQVTWRTSLQSSQNATIQESMKPRWAHKMIWPLKTCIRKSASASR